MAQWLRLHASTVEGMGLSRVGKLRFCMPHGTATKKKKKERKKEIKYLSLNGYTQTQSMSLCKSSSTSATSRELTNRKGEEGKGDSGTCMKVFAGSESLTINVTYHTYSSPVL